MPAVSFKGRHFQHDMILQNVRWYLAYSLNYRDIRELMGETGIGLGLVQPDNYRPEHVNGIHPSSDARDSSTA